MAAKSQRPMRGKPRKKASSSKELKALAALPEDRIELSDIPEVRDWSDARRGLFYRPVKQQLTLRLDADVVAWFKSQVPGGRGYQTEINRALREYVRRSQKQAGR
jgi:uncharacterized protein (DUF4415 family)